MNKKHYSWMIIVSLALALVVAVPVVAQDKVASATTPAETKADMKTDKDQPLAARASRILERQMAEKADKRIPKQLRENAHCVAVFPSVVEAGFVIAAKRGHGVVSCRGENGEWGAPAVLNMTAASVGLQAGAQSASIIMLYMNEKAVASMIEGKKLAMGTGINVAAGPVGGTAAVDTQASVLTYSRSKGLFAGIDVEGAKVTFAKKINAEMYGADATARHILFDHGMGAERVKQFQETLQSFVQ